MRAMVTPSRSDFGWMRRRLRLADITSLQAGEIDESIGNRLQETKRDLLPLIPSDLPEGLKDLASQMPSLRQSGLVRLLRGLMTHSFSPAAQDLLRRWLAENDRLR